MILSFDSSGLGMSLRRLWGLAQCGALSAAHPSGSESEKNASGCGADGLPHPGGLCALQERCFSLSGISEGSAHNRKCPLAFCVQVYSISFAYHLLPSGVIGAGLAKSSGLLSVPAPGRALEVQREMRQPLRSAF